jgi:hypothetical protein
VPLQIRNMRLRYASPADASWLADALNREGRRFGTRIGAGPDRVLRLMRLKARETQPSRRVEWPPTEGDKQCRRTREVTPDIFR